MTITDLLGSAWSLWPPCSSRGFNRVSGARRVSHSIISVCLIKKGEDLIHPDFGIAPDLFAPLSDSDPEYVVYHLEEELRRWVEGWEVMQVRAMPDDPGNALNLTINFLPQQDFDTHLLTFPFYQYQGAFFGDNLAGFLDSINLDGQPFRALV